MVELDERAYIPFFNCNKKDIALLYNELQLEHSLLPVTRSCENDQHPASHCNECWWCRERIWAFGYTDGL
jgi:7-cyano-7-deazaguanine synthase in queuosine biosynthesis